MLDVFFLQFFLFPPAEEFSDSQVVSEEPGDWTEGTTVSQLMSRISADIITEISPVSKPDQRAGDWRAMVRR